MDKWEDTVINDDEIKREVIRKTTVKDTSTIERRVVAKRQAKIAFKAGKDKGKQEGFDEVVEWVEKEKQTAYIYEGQISAYDTKHDTTMLLDYGDWQAFLKERLGK